MFSLICARINGWVNNREAGDLWRHRAHYDVIVMSTSQALRTTYHVLYDTFHESCTRLAQFVLCGFILVELILSHDDVIKWKHFQRNWPFVREIHWSPVNSPHKGQWRGALMFSLICVWINDWVNNGDAGDLIRYCAHCDVINVSPLLHSQCNILQWPQYHGSNADTIMDQYIPHPPQTYNTLQWRHNELDGVSNNPRLDCSLNCLFRRRSQNIKTPRHWTLWGEFTGDR